jgi:hypothetical protein
MGDDCAAVPFILAGHREVSRITTNASANSAGTRMRSVIREELGTRVGDSTQKESHRSQSSGSKVFEACIRCVVVYD